MKLRTQFFIMVGGNIVVPFMVTAFMLLMQYSIDKKREPFPDYDLIKSWVGQQVPQGVQRHNLAELMKDRPPGLDLLILDTDEVVSFSSIDAIPPGTSALSGTLWNYMAANIDRYHFSIDSPNEFEGARPLIIMKTPKLRPDETRFRNLTISIAMYSSVSLLVFSALMSFLILRSLNISIKSLEGATRRIAEGDLDFKLPARGNDQISSLTRSFDSMRRALKEEFARRSRFIMGVSHDLRTPLTLIQGYVEAIADGYASGPETQAKYLSIILDKTHSLEGMVRELIEFSRMETGQWRMTHRDVPARQFLTDHAKRFAEDATILKRAFTWNVDVPDAATVRMDAGLVTRALENLIGNAIRYTPENGTISLEARMDGGDILLALSDAGIGIPAEDLPRIYDPFYRGTNSRREQGFGLGLTTVKSIIEGHGWEIGVSSTVGQGTTFTIRMPLSGVKAADGARGGDAAR
jgi:signal transduction histidine kinase